MEPHAAHSSLHRLYAVFILLLVLRMASTLDLPLDRHSILGDLVSRKVGRNRSKKVATLSADLRQAICEHHAVVDPSKHRAWDREHLAQPVEEQQLVVACFLPCWCP